MACVLLLHIKKAYLPYENINILDMVVLDAFEITLEQTIAT